MDIRSKIADANKIVIKVGTSTLTHENGKLNLNRIEKLARVLSDLNNQGKQVILVSSGAIAVGVQKLGLQRRSVTLPQKQASASVGQTMLMKIYQKFFEEYNQVVSQILITKDVMDYKDRKENAQNTFNTLLEMGIIPIVNENDTISTFEIQFGDNDTLSAMVAALVQADLLILLSDIDGLFTSDPRMDSSAEIISLVKEIDSEIDSIASGSGSELGTGGMITKISAARIGYTYGIDTIIANGEDPKIIYKILKGEKIGTLFLAPNNL
ncbi:glutamate 5-kinase ProB [Gottschalkia purinilytica]|uniref:Glutamate 5-kinase n=1 Tax=Gottschalkia purinilytica TaxID=1503 RepID=A0A0L0WEV2_GOTPU|nr:glutamate 5-kinase [Gottschalkia purinilytica]KNF10012.1 glutamate 5-kinase ProB [Gottschalkia purinilytica]